MSDIQDRPRTHVRPLTSPSPRRQRNAKGLALNLGFGGEAPQKLSAPSSPSFVKPEIPKARKKPSILSLQTSNSSKLQPRLAVDAPLSPVIKTTTIRHHHSSPQLMFSPDPQGMSGPEGGMQLPFFERSRITGLSNVLRKPSTLKEANTLASEAVIPEEDSPIRTQMASRSIADIRGDIFDGPVSQEDAKSPAYPDGPVAVYEPNVFLYLEPTANEAANFDVVLNVASEVKNPFLLSEKPAQQQTPTKDGSEVEDGLDFPEPTTAMSAASYTTAFEFPMGDDTPPTPRAVSPTTPKATTKEPEYIHVPWEHNTDITRELMGLCETIDRRTKEGKKVLVHCQQGASRSASLIIAYGMYRNPKLTVNDAYHAAQAKSKWISPNMKLMYALSDFEKELRKRQGISPARSRSRLSRSPTKHRATLSADAIEFSPKEPPQTAPLPADRDPPYGDASPGTGSRARGNSTPSYGDISPGPSSAPSSYNLLPRITPSKSAHDSKPTDTQSSRLFPPPGSSFASLAPPSSSMLPQDSDHHPPPTPAMIPQGFGFHPPPTPAMKPEGFGSHRLHHRASHLSLAPTLSATPEHAMHNPTPVLDGSKHPYSNAPTDEPSRALWSPRMEEMTANPLHHTFNFPQATSQQDIQPITDIMSPRATGFAINPFHQPRFVAAQEAMGNLGFTSLASGMVEAGAVSAGADPRSPAITGEAPITRSIDDML